MHAQALKVPAFNRCPTASDDDSGRLDGVLGQADRSSHLLSNALRTAASTFAYTVARKDARIDASTEQWSNN